MNEKRRSGFAMGAKCYMRLAEQADQNGFQDLWFEFGPFARRVGDVHRRSDRDLRGPNRGELASRCEIRQFPLVHDNPLAESLK